MTDLLKDHTSLIYVLLIFSIGLPQAPFLTGRWKDTWVLNTGTSKYEKIFYLSHVTGLAYAKLKITLNSLLIS